MKSFFLFEVESTADGAVDVSIPSPIASGPGAEALVRDMSDGTNPVTATPVAGKIDGASNVTVPAGAFVRLLSDGSQWMNVSGAGGGGGWDPTSGDPVSTFQAISDAAFQVQAGSSVTIDASTSASLISENGDLSLVAGDPDDHPNKKLRMSGGGLIADFVGASAGGHLFAETNIAIKGGATGSLEGGVSVTAGASDGNVGLIAHAASGRVFLQTLATDIISEYDGAGSVQLPFIAPSDATSVSAKFNLLLTYLAARGTMAAS